MQYSLDISYEGAAISLRYDQEARAELHINGRLREAVNSDKPIIKLKMGSSVQTGYEYHEYIEATADYTGGGIAVSISASAVNIAQAHTEIGE